LDTLSLDDLISSLKSHEIELVGDKSSEKFKPLALIAKDKSAKALQTTESAEESSDEDYDSYSDVVETTYLTKRFQHLTRRKKPSSRSSSSNNLDIKDLTSVLKKRV
jgi:hypothetical protein